MTQTRKLFRRSGLLAASAISFACLWVSPAYAQQAVPASFASQQSEIDQALGQAGTEDLATLKAKLDEVAAAALACQGLDCPQLLTCEEAQQLERDIFALLSLLSAQDRALEAASQAALAHFLNQVDVERLNDEAKGRLVQSIILQDTLIRISDALAQFETIVGATRTLSKGNSSGAAIALDATKLVANLRALHITLTTTNAPSVIPSHAPQWLQATPPPGIAALDDSAAVAGSLAGAALKLQEAETLLSAIRLGGDAAGATRFLDQTDSVLVDVGEILQALLSRYAKNQLEDSVNYLGELQALDGSNSAATQAAARFHGEVVARRIATKSAIASAETALRQLSRCMRLADCPPGERLNVALLLPDFFEQAPDGTNRFRWGAAAVRIRREIEELRPSISPVRFRNDCGDPEDQTNALPDTGLTFAFDSTTFCTFTEANPLFVPFFLPLEEPAPPPSGEGPPAGEVPPPGGQPDEDPDPASEPGERIFRESPFPSAPLPEDLPPCEQLDLLRQAIEKEYQDAANENFSPQDRLAALNRAEELEARVRQVAEECLPKPPPEQGEEEQSPDGGPFRALPFPSAPIPEGLPPCEEVKLLQDGIEKEVRDAMNPEFSPEERRAAKARADALEERAQKVFPECQRTRELPFPTGEEPPDTGEPVPEPAPTPEPQPATPPVIVNVKATSDAIARGSDASELSGQVVRLFAPSQLAQALPTPGGARPQDDHAADPIQVVTDRNGDAQLAVPSEIRLSGFGRFGLAYNEGGQEACTPTTKVSQRLRLNFDSSRECDSGVTLGGRFRLEYDATPQDSVNVIAEKPEYLAGVLSRESLFGRFADFGTIGGFTVGTLIFDKDQGERITTQLRLEFPLLLIEPNLCRIKEPAAVTEYHACKLGDRVPPAGARVLTPPDPREELPGAALDLAQIHEEHE